MTLSPSEHPDCPFCRIVLGNAPAEVVAAGEDWLALFPIHPATTGHTLIIPKMHVPHLWAAPVELAERLVVAAVSIGGAIRRALNPEGLNLITSAGDAAEQTVFHLHLHVVPRWASDGFGEIWPSKEPFRNENLLDAADRIRTELRR